MTVADQARRAGVSHRPTITVSNAFVATAGVVVLLSLVRRAAFGFEAPFWLDETVTGVIATQPGLGSLVTRLLQEVGGPVYYVFVWLWEKLVGPGDLALRLPSLAFAVVTSAFVWWKGHPDRLTRVLWCLLCSLWVPIYFYASEARSYTLLYLLATVQVVVFIDLLRDPSLRRATIWAIVSGLFILTHIHALLPSFAQGVCFLAVHRARAVRTWPAALVFVPVFVWLGFQLHTLLLFSSPQYAWQTLLTRRDLVPVFANVLSLPKSRTVAALILVSFAIDFVLRRRAGTPLPYRREDVLAAAISLLSLVVVVALGFIRPNFTLRYLIPFMPGVLLGVAIWARAMAERAWWLPWLLLAGLTVMSAADTGRLRTQPDGRWFWNWEIASADLQAAGARRLFFTWDAPTARIGGPEADPFRDEIAGFFFRRAGHPIPTKFVLLPPGSDPNVELLARATRPGDAVIWAFDPNVPRTLAVEHPPRLTAMDPGLRCRNKGGNGISIITCLRVAPPRGS